MSVVRVVRRLGSCPSWTRYRLLTGSGAISVRT